jgi:hypothetical protein
MARALLFYLAVFSIMPLLIGCGEANPPFIGEVYKMQAPGLNIQGHVTALGECGALADEEINDGDLIGAALQPQPDDPATPCASLLAQMPGQQVAYIVPLEYLQNEGFWNRIDDE